MAETVKLIRSDNPAPSHLIGGDEMTWKELIDVELDKIINLYGGSIRDTRTGKTWDPGQALCAETYGPHWMTSPEFAEDDGAPFDAPVPDRVINALDRMLETRPDWMPPARLEE